MTAQWIYYKNKFAAFDTRERALLVGAALALVYLLWNLLLLQPLDKAIDIARAKERSAQQTINNVTAELKVLDTLSRRDPDAGLKKELEQLAIQQQELDQQLTSLTLGLIKVDDLPVMLHQLLAQTTALKLRSLTTLPIEAMNLHSSTQADSAHHAVDSSAQGAQLFKHGVQVSFSGSYAATYAFIKALEDSQWNFYWDSLDYQVVHYPDAAVTVTLFTLASDKGIFHANPADSHPGAD